MNKINVAERIWVESLSEMGAVHPALQFFAVREPEWRIPRLRPLTSLEEAGTLLANQTPRCVTVAAAYRAAVAGKQFVLQVRISDAAPQRGNKLWDDSCIEVFTHDRDSSDRPAGEKPGESKRFGLELRVFTTLAKSAGSAPFLCFGALTPHHRRAGCATVIPQ